MAMTEGKRIFRVSITDVPLKLQVLGPETRVIAIVGNEKKIGRLKLQQECNLGEYDETGKIGVYRSWNIHNLSSSGNG